MLAEAGALLARLGLSGLPAKYPSSSSTPDPAAPIPRSATAAAAATMAAAEEEAPAADASSTNYFSNEPSSVELKGTYNCHTRGLLGSNALACLGVYFRLPQAVEGRVCYSQSRPAAERACQIWFDGEAWCVGDLKHNRYYLQCCDSAIWPCSVKEVWKVKHCTLSTTWVDTNVYCTASRSRHRPSCSSDGDHTAVAEAPETAASGAVAVEAATVVPEEPPPVAVGGVDAALADASTKASPTRRDPCQNVHSHFCFALPIPLPWFL